MATNDSARQTGSPTTLRRKGCERQIEVSGEGPTKWETERTVQARKTILEYEGFRARIDMSKPQQVICHLIICPVNKIPLAVEIVPDKMGSQEQEDYGQTE